MKRLKLTLRSGKKVEVKHKAVSTTSPKTKSILASSFTIHTQLVYDLCFGVGDSHKSTLISFDRGCYDIEAELLGVSVPGQKLSGRILRIADVASRSKNLLEKMRPPVDPDFSISANESVNPVVCPPFPVGKHKPLPIISETVEKLRLLSRLEDFDKLVLEALALRKFGYCSEAYWATNIQGIARLYSELFDASRELVS